MCGGHCIGCKRQELHFWSTASIASGSAYIYSVLLMLNPSSIGILSNGVVTKLALSLGVNAHPTVQDVVAHLHELLQRQFFLFARPIMPTCSSTGLHGLVDV